MKSLVFAPMDSPP